MHTPYAKYTVEKDRKPATEYARRHPWNVWRPHPFYAGDLIGSFATQGKAMRFAQRCAFDNPVPNSYRQGS